MGALTSNRKRGDEFSNLTHGFPYLSSPNSSLHSSKRPRLVSPSHPDRVAPPPSMNPSSASSKPAIVRVSEYPEATKPLPRFLAPTGNRRFGQSPAPIRRPDREREPASVSRISMGNILVSKYDRAKNLALGVCRMLRKEKEVVELERDVEDGGDFVVEVLDDDSSIEEIEVVEDGEDLERGPDARMSAAEAEVSNAAAKVESLSLGVNRDEAGLAVYKKLIRDMDPQRERLNRLGSDIAITEQQRTRFQFLRSALKKQFTKRNPEDPFDPLTKEEETDVHRAFSTANRRKVLVSHENSNIEITGQVLQCLRPGAWLNDEVINLYLELLKEREKRDPKRHLKCHFFNTFFYKKLTGGVQLTSGGQLNGGGGYDFKSVRRWTTQRKLGYSLADCDKIFIPIHRQVHWCLAVINKQDRKIQYLDSLRGTDYRVLQVLARYYADEVKDKTGKEIDITSWKLEFVEDLPEQLNGYDCGVFMVKNADFYSQRLKLCFTQDNMPYFRLRIAKEILRLRAD